LFKYSFYALYYDWNLGQNKIGEGIVYKLIILLSRQQIGLKIISLHIKSLKLRTGKWECAPVACALYNIRFLSLIFVLFWLWVDFLQLVDLTVHKIKIPILSSYFICGPHYNLIFNILAWYYSIILFFYQNKTLKL